MQTNTNNQVYAGFFPRLAAFLIDMLIVNAALLVIRIPKWVICIGNSEHLFVRDFIFQYSIFDILIYGLTVLYFVLFTYYTGATLGKKLFHLRVVSTENRKLTLFEVIYRETIGRFLSAVILNLGYFLILIEKQKRGIHDLLADTCVVYYHEKRVYLHTPVTYRDMTAATGYTMNDQGCLTPGEETKKIQKESPVENATQESVQTQTEEKQDEE